LDGRCFEREAVPFKMLDGLVDTLTAVVLGLTPEQQTSLAPRELGSLMRLFPVLRRVPTLVELEEPTPVDLHELRPRGFQALRELDGAPLTAHAAIALVAELAEGSERAAKIVAAGHGNPLILTELAREELTDLESIDALVRARVQRLPVEVQAMLSVISIAAR